MNQLYDELAKLFPNHWRRNWSRNIRSSVQTKPLAQCFSQFLLDETRADCYSRLLDELRKSGKIEETIFGSLNYDCLLEQAASHLGLRVDYSCATQAPDTACVAKLHGSANFVGEIDPTCKAILAGTMVQVEVSEIIELPVIDLGKQVSTKFGDTTTTYLPVMGQVSHFKEMLLAPAKIQWATELFYKGGCLAE